MTRQILFPLTECLVFAGFVGGPAGLYDHFASKNPNVLILKSQGQRKTAYLVGSNCPYGAPSLAIALEGAHKVTTLLGRNPQSYYANLVIHGRTKGNAT